MYVVDLSDRRIVKLGGAGLGVAVGDEAVLPLPVPEFWTSDGVEVVVPSRYRNTCGTTAWYCASRAKMVAVGPEGR